MKKLTLKERRFTEEYVRTANGTEAAFNSYNTKSKQRAGAIAYTVLRKPHIKAEIERLLTEMKLDEEKALTRLNEGLDAKIPYYDKKSGEMKLSEIPDMNVRHKYFQDSAKIMDLYPPTRTESRNVSIDLQLEKMSKEELSTILQGLLSNINETKQRTLTSPIENGTEGESKE